MLTTKTYTDHVVVETSSAEAAQAEVQRQIDKDGLVCARVGEVADDVDEEIGGAELAEEDAPPGVERHEWARP